MYKDHIEQIVPGTSKQDVENILGLRTISSSLDENTWYYIYIKYEENLSFNYKKFIETKVIRIVFKNNLVETVEQFSSNQENKLPFIKDSTPIKLKKTSVTIKHPNFDDELNLLHEK